MTSKFLVTIFRNLHVTSSCKQQDGYKILVVGGGSGGLSASAIFARKLAKGSIGIVEPSEVHYYQPMWTLVGGGIKTLKQSQGETRSYIPHKVDWIKDSVATFEPNNNQIITKSGRKIAYEFLIVALGIQIDLDKISGLKEALVDPQSNVCCNYTPQTVEKTFKVIQRLQSGNAIFTFPDTPIKCAGAAQKIMYLTESLTRKNGYDQVKFHYMTPQDSIFMVPKYAAVLEKIVNERGILFHPKHNLTAIDDDKRVAIFKMAGSQIDNKTEEYNYGMIHVTPPMSAPDVLKKSPLSDPRDPYGYMEVDKEFLCHPKYPNIYGIGDCTNAPKSKTLAAITSELKTLNKNLSAALKGKPPFYKSVGYSSCPLVVSYEKCILAEFDYNKNPLETFPVDQSVPRSSMMFMKKHLMPLLYWTAFLRGYWEGPSTIRKIMRLGM